jgi:hypothetical protein
MHRKYLRGHRRNFVKRVVGLVAHEQRVQQDSKLPCHGYNGPFLRVLATSRGQAQSPAPQIAIFSKAPEHELAALNKHLPHAAVTGFCDPKLWTSLSRLTLPRLQPKKASDLARLHKPARFAYRQDELQRG